MKQIITAGLMLGLLVFTACGQSSATVQAASTAEMPATTSTGVSDDAEYVYVCNQTSASISVIDVATLEIVATVELTELGFDKNAKPHHVAVEPDGSHWYVSLIAAGKVLKFNRDNELLGSVDFMAPGMLALHPEEDLLFVGRSMKAVNPPQRIGIIESDKMKIDEVDVFFPRPHAIAVDPRGEFIYTGSLAVNQFLSMNIESGEISLERLDGDTHTFVQFAISPDGNTMVVGAQLTAQVFVFDTTDPKDVKLVKSIKVNGAPWHPVFTPDGKYVYIGNKMADTVTVLDVEKKEVAKVIEGKGLSQPHGIAISKDGSRIFVSNNNLNGRYKAMNMGADHSKKEQNEKADGKDQVGTLVVIDAAKNEIEKVIELGFYPSGVGTNVH